jgi:parvulin-like peptidyl-prolyl isomerase
MKFLHAFVFLGIAAGLSAQTSTPIPAPQNQPPATAPNRTPVPHVELSLDNPADRKGPVVPPDRVVLSVGDVKLTAEQFDQLVDSLPDQYRSVARGAGRKQFGDNLVRLLVLAQEGKRRKLDDTAAYKLQTMFQMANVLANMTFQQIGKDTKIDEADLRKYYADHKAEFDQVSARHILIRMQGSRVPVKPGQKDLTPEEALAKAEDLEKRIKAGEDFAKLAAAESDDAGSAAKGGDVGFFHHGQMVPSFDQAAFALEVGQVSEPVRSDYGYHIIKVDAAKTFDDVKADVEKRMAPELAQKAVVELQKNSVVVYDTEFFNMAKR